MTGEGGGEKEELIGRTLSALILVFWFVTLVASIQYDGYLRHTGQYHQHASQDHANTDAIPNNQFKPSDTWTKSKQENWAEEAWRHWARRFFTDIKISDALIILFTAALVWVGGAQVRRLSKTIRTMDDTAERQLRAYVHGTVEEHPTVYDNLLVEQPNIGIVIKNCKRLPTPTASVS